MSVLCNNPPFPPLSWLRCVAPWCQSVSVYLIEPSPLYSPPTPTPCSSLKPSRSRTQGAWCATFVYSVVTTASRLRLAARRSRYWDIDCLQWEISSFVCHTSTFSPTSLYAILCTSLQSEFSEIQTPENKPRIRLNTIAMASIFALIAKMT